MAFWAEVGYSVGSGVDYAIHPPSHRSQRTVSNQRVLYLDVCSRRMSVRPAATRLDGRLLGLCVAFLLLITAAGLLYLSQASTVAQLRYQLAENGRERAALEEQVASLRCEVAAVQSIVSLEERIERLGLVDAAEAGPIVVCRVTPAEDEAQPGPQGVAPPAADAPRGLERLLSLVASRK